MPRDTLLSAALLRVRGVLNLVVPHKMLVIVVGKSGSRISDFYLAFFVSRYFSVPKMSSRSIPAAILTSLCLCFSWVVRIYSRKWTLKKSDCKQSN